MRGVAATDIWARRGSDAQSAKQPWFGVPRRGPIRFGPTAVRGDAQASENNYRDGPYPDTQHHGQPRGNVSGCREARSEPGVVRADIQTRESEVRSRSN